jgi:predicted ribosomally synthesized peptide with SipW-like signal peptide
MNKKILASVMVIGLLALAVGWGTYSWFSDTETAEISFTTGSMNLQLSTGTRGGSNGDWKDATSLEIAGPSNWNDEEEYKVVIWFRNTGSLGAKFLYREYFDFVGDTGFLDAVQLVSVYEYYDGAWDSTDWVNGSTDGSISTWGWVRTNSNDGYGDSDDYLMLWELIDMKQSQYDEKCYHYASVVDGAPTEDYLPPGGFVAVEYTFKLRGDKTTSVLQGLTLSFKIECHMTNENIHTYSGPVP